LEKKQRKSEYFKKKNLPESHVPQKRLATGDSPSRKRTKTIEQGSEQLNVQALTPNPKQTSKDIPVLSKPKKLNFDLGLLVDADPDVAKIARLEKLLGRGHKKKNTDRVYCQYLFHIVCNFFNLFWLAVLDDLDDFFGMDKSSGVRQEPLVVLYCLLDLNRLFSFATTGCRPFGTSLRT
jgi:hypothetical protein